MKTSNLILKVLENLQTNVALIAAIREEIIYEMSIEDYDKISEEMSKKELPRPYITTKDMMLQLEEYYNYLEQLLLAIEKPF